jgi:hypothetical protein
MSRMVGLDIHRVFAEAVMLDAGKIVPLGRIGMTCEHLLPSCCSPCQETSITCLSKSAIISAIMMTPAKKAADFGVLQ